ncbi:hypothetical protein [uncultured Roseobacter sp.]|uniref:hypothetical protein n=1 Tax=uncultured Roseobacter sp. TaxID=114847 RepID=UPI0026111A85|nr:hypothetical protein [uncultured Roseobacter sp.]
MPKTRNRVLYANVIAVFAAWVLSAGNMSAREFRIDGWCLRHSGEDLEFYPIPDRPRGISDFRASSDLPLPRKSAGPDDTGLIVSYTPNATYSTREADKHRGRMGCNRVPQDNGLSLLTGENLPNCSVRESRDTHKKWFEPSENFETLDGVSIRCGRDLWSVNCHMTGLLLNGWETQITLPKTHLAEWQVAARTARSYFETYLSDCG